MKFWQVTASALLLISSLAVSSGAFADKQVALLYAEHCAVCHGENGDGKSRARFGLNPAPRDFTSAAAWDELTSERMRTSVIYGRPGTAMVAWDKRLNETQVESLVAYIRNKFMRKPSVSDQQSGLKSGQRLYKKHCRACHGDKGNGAQWTKNSLNPAPRDFTAAAAKAELSYDRMIASVTHGRTGTAMMSFGARLSAAQIEDVVGYVRATFMGFKDEANAPQVNAGVSGADLQSKSMLNPQQNVKADMTLAFPRGLQGDVAKGRHFYLKNCFTCHGKNGDGKGPRSSFIKPAPRNFLSSASRDNMNRPALYRAISKGKAGTVMPAWGNVLNEQQIADVAEFVFSTFIVPEQDASLKKKARN